MYVGTESGDAWYFATLYIYLGLPPLFRLVTLVFGLQLGRWALFEAPNAHTGEKMSATAEAKTLVPALATVLIVGHLHGFLEPETEMHRPDTGSTPLQWVAIHLIHPFNVLALVCGLVAAPHSLVARLLASPPLAKLSELSYAMYLLHYGVITLYVFVFNKKWATGWEPLQASEDATALSALDYGAVVFLSTALAHPVTAWAEPRVATWLEARLARRVDEVTTPPYSTLP